MATTNLICRLRRYNCCCSFLVSRQFQFLLIRSFQSLTSTQPSSPPPSPPLNSYNFNNTFASVPWLGTTSFRRFSSRSSHSEFSAISHSVNSITEAELQSLGFSDGGAEDSVLPVRALISFLDGYHDLTGLPWWIIIVSSTFVFRLTLLPIIILQLQKLKRIGELFPKLPPPLPPPFSGKSFIDQFSLFRRERKAIGCPSYLWFLSSFSVQVPCFFLWVASVRRMSLDHHPGFDTGGILWFQDLTEYPHGVLGAIFPIVIAGLHYFNVQISFRSSTTGKDAGLFGFLVKIYKWYLDVLTVPLLFVGFLVPQGSLVYWVTNSSLTAIQQLFLQHPVIRKKLGLPDKKASKDTPHPDSDAPGSRFTDAPTSTNKFLVQDLSPKELLGLSVKLLAKGNKDGAIPLLRLALDKDPEYVGALIVLGQTLLQKGMVAEGIEFLESTISKLSLVDQPTDVEAVDNLILASQWAGIAYFRQGKTAEALRHLERVASLEEPEDSKSKEHYYSGLLVLASTLSNVGRKDEAVKYLQMVIAYDAKCRIYMEQLENDQDDFVDGLVNSRRADY
ncbi:hypothetical protein Ancab_024469 [Ancistrocladus abbreviatus]